MPVTHLTPAQAADVAAWLCRSNRRTWATSGNDLAVDEPDTKKLEDLVRVYLTRLLPRSDIDTLFKEGKIGKEVLSELPQEEKDSPTTTIKDKMTGLKYYVGKKAVGRPRLLRLPRRARLRQRQADRRRTQRLGQEARRPARLEDINNFAEKHFFKIAQWTDDKGKLPSPKIEKEDGKDVKKMPYEQFFFDDLLHHGRSGYLHQKILDPRSYDYGRIKSWDDRARMPQFRFAQSHPKRRSRTPLARSSRQPRRQSSSRPAPGKKRPTPVKRS